MGNVLQIIHCWLANQIHYCIAVILDSMSTTNPLQGQSMLCNFGVNYYTVKNLPTVFNICFANVHLLALCYSQNLKVYGFNPILEKFVSEIQHLNSKGFSGEFPIIGSCPVYVTLMQFACDNVALNGILGFTESFSADFFCTMCYAVQSYIQRKFREKKFMLRTVNEYEKDVQGARLLFHCQCVKKPSVLNQTSGYHVTKNYSLDIMDIVLEGIIPAELSCILHALCHDSPLLFSLSDLSLRIHNFWSAINVDVCCWPPESLASD